MKLKTMAGLTDKNLAKLSNWYITDRINTKGLTHYSQITIKGHFRQLLRDFEAIPNSFQLSEWLGKRSPSARKRLFQTFRAFGKWLEKKRVIHNPWADIDFLEFQWHFLKKPSLRT